MQGKTISGYTLKSVLGAGGMAEVWLAENKIGKKAAVKILLSKYCDDDNVTSRFSTEAKVMVELNHPNIRQVYDYGEIDGRPCIIMEYLEGDDLKAKIKRGQRFSDSDLTKWWNQLVSALTYTHKQGVVHRDIKPGNIFVDTNGNIKLLDFGIAKVRDSISSTQTGQKIGTLMYMSPEQVKDSKHIDYRTDIYSLAVTFVHLVTGKRPYDSDTTSDFEISSQIVYSPLDLSGVPLPWRDVLTPYLNKDADKRPDLKPITDKASANGGSEETTLDGDSGFGSQPPVSDGTKKEPIQVENKGSVDRKKIIIAVIATIAIIIGAVAFMVIHNNHKRAERITAIYNEKVKMSEVRISKILEDKSKTVIIETLLGLKELEEMENNPLLKRESGNYGVLFDDYVSKLNELSKHLAAEVRRQKNMGTDDEDNPYYVKCRDNLAFVNDILEQSTSGSAKDIQPKRNQ